MTTRRRFAEGTEVEVYRSKAELDQVLAKHGATQRLFAEDEDQNRAIVQFRMSARMVRLELKLPVVKPPASSADPNAPHGWGSWDGARRAEWVRRKREQGHREAWRRVVLVVKAKLEIIADGGSTLEREFLADVLLPDGRTVHELLAQQLEQAYTDGAMPPLLPGKTT